MSEPTKVTVKDPAESPVATLMKSGHQLIVRYEPGTKGDLVSEAAVDHELRRHGWHRSEITATIWTA